MSVIGDQFQNEIYKIVEVYEIQRFIVNHFHCPNETLFESVITSQVRLHLYVGIDGQKSSQKLFHLFASLGIVPLDQKLRQQLRRKQTAYEETETLRKRIR